MMRRKGGKVGVGGGCDHVYGDGAGKRCNGMFTRR